MAQSDAIHGINSSLFKIFGPRGRDYVDASKARPDKGEAQRGSTGHVLGLRDINMSICRPAAITVVMGLSGSGKSTLIRHINRLIEPTSGEVLL